MKKVVTIGGGTGSFMLLSGLKKYPIELSAIVSMADDGGSTGVLRDELGVLPPGDVRQCLAALSDSSEMLRKLMNYRFEEGGLAGHSFGNLLLSALEKISGGFGRGVLEASKILNVKGEVIPVTETDTKIFMELRNGKLLRGEHEINTSARVEKVGVKRVFFDPKPRVNSLAVKRILEADLIVIGPGNHYCSIVPNLLVPGIAEAIVKSKGKIVYNCNLVNKTGHTDNFTLEDYVTAIESFLKKRTLDYVTFNTKAPSRSLLQKYAEKEESLVLFKNHSTRSYRVIRANLLSTKPVRLGRGDTFPVVRGFIRHDGEKLAKVLLMLLELSEYESILKNME